MIYIPGCSEPELEVAPLLKGVGFVHDGLGKDPTPESAEQLVHRLFRVITSLAGHHRPAALPNIVNQRWDGPAESFRLRHIPRRRRPLNDQDMKRAQGLWRDLRVFKTAHLNAQGVQSVLQFWVNAPVANPGRELAERSNSDWTLSVLA